MDHYCIKTSFRLMLVSLIWKISNAKFSISVTSNPAISGQYFSFNCKVPSDLDNIILIQNGKSIVCSLLASSCPVEFQLTFQGSACVCSLDSTGLKTVYYKTDSARVTEDAGVWICKEYNSTRYARSINVSVLSAGPKIQEVKNLPPQNAVPNITAGTSARNVTTVKPIVTELKSTTKQPTPTTITTIRPTPLPTTTAQRLTPLPTTRPTTITSTTIPTTVPSRPASAELTSTTTRGPSPPVEPGATNVTGIIIGVIVFIVAIIIIVGVVLVVVLFRYRGSNQLGLYRSRRPEIPLYINTTGIDGGLSGTAVLPMESSRQPDSSSPVYVNTTNPIGTSSSFRHQPLSQTTSSIYQNDPNNTLTKPESNEYESLTKTPQISLYDKLNSSDGNNSGDHNLVKTNDEGRDPRNLYSPLSPLYMNTGNKSPLASQKILNTENIPHDLREKEIIDHTDHLANSDSRDQEESVSLEYMNFSGKQ